MKRTLNKFLDIILSPFTYLASVWFNYLMRRDLNNFKLSEKIFMNVGVLPVIDHYYFPLINPRKHLKKSLKDDRDLPGIDMKVPEQLSLLSKLSFAEELKSFPVNNTAASDKVYYYDNGMYGRGDAEILYSLIRYYKPTRIIEIGSGKSTLMAINAIEQNRKDNGQYTCDVTCIEPYEQSMLEQLQVNVIRERVEDLDLSIFDKLEENDILFIDSSHIIRPQGDVLIEILSILPRVKPGVIVHVHDIFTPRDYPEKWILKSHNFWNEQYLLEAFLSFNSDFSVLLALNYLAHNHRKELDVACPMLAATPEGDAGSFWFRRNN